MRGYRAQTRRGGGGTALLVGRVVVGARHVQCRVDHLRDRLYLRAELLLDAVQGEPILVRDQVDRDTEVTETSRATDAVKVGLRHAREVEINDDVDRLHVDTSCKEIGTDQIAAETCAEVVEHAVAMRLRHARVYVVAAVAQLRYLLGE